MRCKISICKLKLLVFLYSSYPNVVLSVALGVRGCVSSEVQVQFLLNVHWIFFLVFKIFAAFFIDYIRDVEVDL